MEDLDLGTNQFCWEVDAPNYSLMPDETDILDSTIIMVTVYYKKQRFFRCSYLIRQFYQDESLNEQKSEKIYFDKLFREIKTEKPIITLYELAWEENSFGGQSNIIKSEFDSINLLKDDNNEKIGDVVDRSALLQQLSAENKILLK